MASGGFSPEILATSASDSSPTSFFYYLLVPTLLLWFTYWKLSRRRMIEMADKLPGPPGLPLVGNGLDFLGTPHGKFFLLIKSVQLQTR